MYSNFAWMQRVRCRFILIDLGNAGHRSDGGVLANSEFSQALESGSLVLPSPGPLLGTADLPYIFVGDEAFPFRTNMLPPYLGKHLPGMYMLLLSTCRK